ncbi:MAG: LCP family protein [Clostridia bacterium]|nr:LCP family protein [Clostridia bacterium]
MSRQNDILKDKHHSSHHHSSHSSSHHHSSHHHSSHHHSHSSSRRISPADQKKIDNLVSKYQVVENTSRVTEKAPKRRHRHSRLRPGTKAVIILVSIPLALIIAFSAAFAVLNIVGRSNLPEIEKGIEDNKYSVSYDEGKTIVYNGKKYALNDNIVTIAGIGVDREGFGLVNDTVGTAGQADTIIIVALDLDSGKVSAVMIPRDTMVDVDLYSVSGTYVGVDRMQICLSYAYGDGKVTSCENVITSVERILYGIPVNLYGVLELQGIPALNDAVGGITVESLETFDKFTKGQRITLYGDDAVIYVRERNAAMLNSDALRRERQIQYLRSFIQKTASSALKNFGIITDLYNVASEYSFTNISLSKLTYLATTLLSKGITFDEIVSLRGELVDADPYPEYIVDEEAVFETVLSIFYNPVSE